MSAARTTGQQMSRRLVVSQMPIHVVRKPASSIQLAASQAPIEARIILRGIRGEEPV